MKKESDTFELHVYNITYKSDPNKEQNYPTRETVEIPSCLMNKDNDYAWYVRNYLEKKYKTPVFGFQY